LDISGLPGVEALTAKEAELCANARLLPAHYLSLKDVMMRDAQVHGHISRIDVSSSSGCGCCWLFCVLVMLGAQWCVATGRRRTAIIQE
jgi:hypothetical protein